MSLQTNNIYEFEGFRLDFSEKTLQGSGGMIPLTPKVFETLCVLVGNAGRLIEKDELMQKLWQDRFVEESNLTFNIKMLRKALGDNAHRPQFIETVQSRGYRFIADVTLMARDEQFPLPAAASQSREDMSAFPTSVPVRRSRASQTHAIVNLAEWRENENHAETLTRISEAVIPKDVDTAEIDAGHARRVKQLNWQNPLVVPFLAALIVSVIALGYYFIFAAKASTGADVKVSIAVLPLKPINTATRDEIYEVGIADSLIQRLSSLKGFIVRPLSAMRKYADIEQDAVMAGKDQQVDFVLASNYQLADRKIRITSQLINVSTGQVEETYKFEKEATGVFAIQDAVAANIGQSLWKKLTKEPIDLAAKRFTTNEAAYRFYIQGMALAEKRKDIPKAIECFEEAVRLDPNYALAYAELASAHSVGLNSGGRYATEEYLKAKAAIEKALSIDDDLAEAHSYVGVIRSNYEWDFAGAEAEHKRAIELDPNSSTAHCLYALLLATLGRPDESVAEMKLAIELEPASAGNHHSLGWIYFIARRYDDAIAEEQRALEMDPELHRAYNVLTNSYSLKGEDDKAFEAFLQMGILSGDEPAEINSLKTIYARSGWRGISERQLEEAKAKEKKGDPNYAKLAGISIDLGQREQAIDYLQKAVDQNRFTLITLKVNPRYDPLRSDPRFDDLIRRVGLR